jgi:hypothetical protein
MKKTTLLFLFLWFPAPLFAQLGAGGGWSEKTACGTSIDQYDYMHTRRIHLDTKNLSENKFENVVIEGVATWYFYKNHIIGTLANDSTLKTNGYFVIDEKKPLITRFETETEWKNFIKKQNLEPFYTRWYADNWRLDTLPLFILGILFSPLWLILLGIILFSLSKAVDDEGLSFRNINYEEKYTFRVLCASALPLLILFITLFSWITGVFPDSI